MCKRHGCVGNPSVDMGMAARYKSLKATSVSAPFLHYQLVTKPVLLLINRR